MPNQAAPSMRIQELPKHLCAPVLKAELDALLEEWSWLDLRGMRPQRMTVFGDWILRGDDGTLSFLDTIEGELRPLHPGPAPFQEALLDPQVRDDLFLEGLVLAVLGRAPLPAGHCLSFKVPPILGGTTDPSNIEVKPASSVQAWLGRLHGALHNLPAGAQVTRVLIEDGGRVRLEWSINSK